ncbi:MAG: YwbE family protein [Patescibacteria group bacterium]
MTGRDRAAVAVGKVVEVVLKADQESGKRTKGVVAEILTSSSFHPRGIKVRLENGLVGRVQEIITQ